LPSDVIFVGTLPRALLAEGTTKRIPKATLSLVRVAVSVAAFALSIPPPSASEVINPPAARHVGLLTTPASELYRSMTAQRYDSHHG
jgi:hypothetical protein